MMNIKKYIKNYTFLAVIASIGILFLCSTSNVVAEEGSFALTNVSVQVADVTWIDISPDMVMWHSVNPGAYSTNFTDLETSTTDHRAFVIRNIGSSNITKIWFNATYPSASNTLYSDIYGTGDLALYDTANFVTVSVADKTGNDSAIRDDNDKYFFINKVEYAEAVYNISGSSWNLIEGNAVPYVKFDNPTDYGSAGADTLSVGRIRDAKNEYFWVLVANPTEHNCSNTGGTNYPEFFVGIVPHNQTNVGDIEFESDCDQTTCYQSSNMGSDATNDRALLAVDDGEGRWQNVAIATMANCRGIYAIQWNRDMAGVAGNNNKNYWITDVAATPGEGKVDSTGVSPGEYYTAWVKLALPYGVPTGTLQTGTITVLAS
ncbi:MAG: hypothetical protein KAR87_06480 [Candidatus Aenigmarchaeota archaeon]|nr:hypothetical protein [Candidatus Aenigmarchaeota archaeon]